MVNSIAPHMVTFGRAATAAGELFSLIDRESEINPLDDSGLKPQSTNGTIKISNISFSYPTRPDIRVLDNFSLNVPAGKVTALVVSSPVALSHFPTHPFPRFLTQSVNREQADLERARS